MSSVYKTVDGVSQAVFREKMSKFIAIATPVRTVDEARAVIDRIRNEYCDARHVCWAYMLGAARNVSQLNDNGEPSGTAGKPILGQINSFGLTNIVVCVVRYFGGIKLGTSGLIAAYREATRLALSEATIVEKTEEVALKITFGYLVMNDVMKNIKKMQLQVLGQQFDNTCSIELAVRKDNAEEIAEMFKGIEGVDAEIDIALL